MKKKVLRCTIMFLLVAFILTANGFADNWQQWRGMHNDGISKETEAPIQWSQTENIKWRLPLPGEAASTPVVWEDKIFLTSAEGDALVLMCITTDGEELWKRTLGHGNRDVRGGEGNSAAPSPVTDGEPV
ncbi:MAG: PQQ-binding-like beta-propeller repeat protein [Candidatus Poribacteria bacterium]|nr:PQQ-binding-like beta-propeller repeat protein [Candidatus Poribacteria bacterium]